MLDGLREKGIAYQKLVVAKGRDGVTKVEINMTFYYRKHTFREKIQD